MTAFLRFFERLMLLGAVAFMVSASQPAASAPAGWEVLSNDDGIEVARKTMPNSSLFAFRGKAVLNVHVAILAETLINDAIGPEWVDLMYLSKMLKQEGRHSKIIRQGYDLPWPISDRDYVMRQVADFNADTKVVTLKFESIQYAGMPVQDCCVRANAYRTYWRLEALPGGKTKAEVEVFTDPMGLLPSWLINLIQADWPSNTLTGLYTRATKGDIKPHPDAAAW